MSLRGPGNSVSHEKRDSRDYTAAFERHCLEIIDKQSQPGENLADRLCNSQSNSSAT